MYNKIKSNISIYSNDINTKGIAYFFVARILKFKTTRTLFNLFRPSKVMVNGLKMHVDKNDTIISHELITNKIWDRYGSALFSILIKNGFTVLDIGAHIGYYTLLSSQKVGEKGQVISVEPDPHNFSYLKKNILSNNLKNVKLIHKAAGDKKKKVTFHVNTINTGDNRVFDNGQLRKVIKVDQVRLDDVLKDHSIDVIKIDIQGSELGALKGLTKTLKKNKEIIVFTELWPEGLEMSGSSLKEYLSFLEKMDFIFYIVDELGKSIKKTTSQKLQKEYDEKKLYDANLLCTRKPLSSKILQKMNSL